MVILAKPWLISGYRGLTSNHDLFGFICSKTMVIFLGTLYIISLNAKNYWKPEIKVHKFYI